MQKKFAYLSAAFCACAVMFFASCSQPLSRESSKEQAAPPGGFTFSWQADGSEGGAASPAASLGTVLGPFDNGVFSVKIILNAAPDGVTVSGADAGKVAISAGRSLAAGDSAVSILTVDTSSIAESGGALSFTLTAGSSSFDVKVVVQDSSGAWKAFWAIALQGSSEVWYQLTAKKVGESANCVVYGDTASLGTKYRAEQAQTVADTFDSTIYSCITGAFGGPADIDGNGKVLFLLLDIQDGYENQGDTYTGGYFHSLHMLSKDAYPQSNAADMLFLDVYPQSVESLAFYSTMAHEFQHLINWSETIGKGRQEKDTWINEGLSTGAEYVYGLNSGSGADPNSRVNGYRWYKEHAGANFGAAIDTFFVWGNKPDSILMDYSTAYLFFQWLRIHASNDTGVYREIISTHNYGDYRDVTAAAASKIAPQFSDWSRLLSTWMIANATQMTTGFYGYKNDAAIGVLTHVYFTNTGGRSCNLYPGEGVFSSLGTNTEQHVNEGAIKYVAVKPGADSSDIDDDDKTPFYGNRTPQLLTLNVDPDKNHGASPGQLAGSRAGLTALSASSSMSASVSGTPAAAPPASCAVSMEDLKRIRRRQESVPMSGSLR